MPAALRSFATDVLAALATVSAKGVPPSSRIAAIPTLTSLDWEIALTTAASPGAQVGVPVVRLALGTAGDSEAATPAIADKDTATLSHNTSFLLDDVFGSPPPAAAGTPTSFEVELTRDKLNAVLGQCAVIREQLGALTS